MFPQEKKKKKETTRFPPPSGLLKMSNNAVAFLFPKDFFLCEQ